MKKELIALFDRQRDPLQGYPAPRMCGSVVTCIWIVGAFIVYTSQE